MADSDEAVNSVSKDAVVAALAGLETLEAEAVERLRFFDMRVILGRRINSLDHTSCRAGTHRCGEIYGVRSSQDA